MPEQAFLSNNGVHVNYLLNVISVCFKYLIIKDETVYLF